MWPKKHKKQDVREQAKSRGVAAALGLLAAAVKAAQERVRHLINRRQRVDPETADQTEAERLAQHKQSERYQTYQVGSKLS